MSREFNNVINAYKINIMTELIFNVNVRNKIICNISSSVFL